MILRLLFTFNVLVSITVSAQITYPIVDTGVSDFYNNNSVISSPGEGDPFYGQDATYNGNQPNYTDNQDGTVTDNITGLIWQKNMGEKISYDEAVVKAEMMTLGGYNDWRIPTIKELYSLSNFTGRCFGDMVIDEFIDTNYFDQPIGDTSNGEREIDAQTWSQTPCVDLLVAGDVSIYGYNFLDGRLKGYPIYDPQTGSPNTMYFRMVRGVSNYGINNFSNNNDGTIMDNATGLMWQQADDGNTYDWENALSYAENLTLGGYSDWRLPNAKELQSIVDYTRSPNSTSSPAINPLFSCTPIIDPYGDSGQYGYYWSSSPLQDGPEQYSDAVYFCFGKAQGQMEMPPGSGNFQLLDVHGAGAQRNDPKTGDPSDFPDYFGPQGDVRYVFNFVRCVRDVNSVLTVNDTNARSSIKIYPNPALSVLHIESTGERIHKVEIIDLNGQMIKVISDVTELKNIDIKTLPSGVYFLKLYGANGNTIRKIIVK
ncbi:MAG: hypothetical protein Aureis2KO_03810 [Aureisphaera sp.]